jgi:hypothetical protein
VGADAEVCLEVREEAAKEWRRVLIVARPPRPKLVYRPSDLEIGVARRFDGVGENGAGLRILLLPRLLISVEEGRDAVYALL